MITFVILLPKRNRIHLHASVFPPTKTTLEWQQVIEYEVGNLACWITQEDKSPLPKEQNHAP